MAWLALVVAGLFEIVWAVAMKCSNGFTRPGPSIVMAAAMLVSVGLLAWAMRAIDLGTAYAVWTGIGAAGTAIVGMALFHEPRDALRLGCLALILIGVLGLRLLSR